MPISKKMEKRNGGTEGIQRKEERKVRLLRRNDAFSRIFHCTTLHHEGPRMDEIDAEGERFIQEQTGRC